MANLGPAVTNTANTFLQVDVGTQADAAALKTPYILSKSGVPMVNVSSGTMGNNGALSGITALATAYANCYMYFPAGAIASGVPAAAAWYFVQMSSTTAGTVFNNLYTTGVPVVPTVPTAFVTTGPGAFTGVTAAAVGPLTVIPAGAMGANGQIRGKQRFVVNNTAGAKTIGFSFGGTGYTGASLANQVQGMSETLIANQGVTNKQAGGTLAYPGASVTQSAEVVSTVDTTAAVTIDHGTTKAVATDNIVLSQYSVEILSDGT